MSTMEKNPGSTTLAACEVCGRYEEVPLDAKKLAVAEFDHTTDHHPAYPARYRSLTALLDPAGEWAVIIRSVQGKPQGRQIK